VFHHRDRRHHVFRCILRQHDPSPVRLAAHRPKSLDVPTSVAFRKADRLDAYPSIRTRGRRRRIAVAACRQFRTRVCDRSATDPRRRGGNRYRIPYREWSVRRTIVLPRYARAVASPSIQRGRLRRPLNSSSFPRKREPSDSEPPKALGPRLRGDYGYVGGRRPVRTRAGPFRHIPLVRFPACR